MPKLKPTILGREGLTKTTGEKGLLLPLKKKGGRNARGRITIRFRGGGAKRRYRLIDFGEEKLGIEGRVLALEYDPNRTAFLALIEYENGQKGYILAPQGMKTGEKIICHEEAEIKIGNRTKLKRMPLGTIVYNIELMPGKGGKLARSAGGQARVVGHEDKYALLSLPSKELRRINKECFASIGQISHAEHEKEIWGQAGRKRLKGKKPRVRGEAMTPADHPHGGGEGKQPRGMSLPKTPWGKPAKGRRTRPKKWTDALIVKRR